MGVPSTDRKLTSHTPVAPAVARWRMRGAVFRAHQGEDIGPNELLGGPPQQLFGPAIDAQDGALFVKKDRLQGGIGQLVKPCLARAQCRLAGMQRLGHVLQGLAQLKQLAGARQGRSDL